MEYQIQIKETLEHTETVSADSETEAMELVRKAYNEEKIILDSESFTDVEFAVGNKKPRPYYKSPDNNFVLAHGNCFKLLKEFDFKFDMIFADPPYFLSNGGISLQSGKVVCVDKGEWEKTCSKHPTQKPLRLLVRIILASTNQGDWVLDPFSGSSTTGIAANLCGRRFAGLEQDEAFCEMSKARREEIENVESFDNLVHHIDDLQKLLGTPMVNETVCGGKLPF